MIININRFPRCNSKQVTVNLFRTIHKLPWNATDVSGGDISCFFFSSSGGNISRSALLRFLWVTIVTPLIKMMLFAHPNICSKLLWEMPCCLYYACRFLRLLHPKANKACHVFLETEYWPLHKIKFYCGKSVGNTQEMNVNSGWRVHGKCAKPKNRKINFCKSNEINRSCKDELKTCLDNCMVVLRDKNLMCKFSDFPHVF